MNDMAKNILLWVIIAVVLMSVFNNFGPPTPRAQSVVYSDFIADVKAGRIQSVVIDGRTVKGQLAGGEKFSTYTPNDPEMINDLLANGVQVKAQPPEQDSLLMQIFISWFPMLLLIGVWIFFMRQMQGGGGGRGAMSFGKSRARMLGEDQVKVTFTDVAGVEEAKEEVAELVEFLRDPGKFQKLGGKIPQGVLMVGSPGTGKTLLAKAIAGEAKVPFFTISGSDFVEMFVGVGASRVRDMFDQAKKHAPCIIFIDEIDAVGRHRGAGLGGGHDEREQTLAERDRLLADREAEAERMLADWRKARQEVTAGGARHQLSVSSSPRLQMRAQSWNQRPRGGSQPNSTARLAQTRVPKIRYRLPVMVVRRPAGAPGSEVRPPVAGDVTDTLDGGDDGICSVAILGCLVEPGEGDSGAGRADVDLDEPGLGQRTSRPRLKVLFDALGAEADGCEAQQQEDGDAEDDGDDDGDHGEFQRVLEAVEHLSGNVFLDDE